MSDAVWMRDTSVPGVVVELGLTRVRCRRRTPYQEVVIGDTESFGKALFMDGNIQSAASDEAAYHAALVHPAMLSHPRPRRVLVGGGGEGATLREVLRHPEVEHVLMVDIDEAAVQACREHLPEWHQGAFDDPRVELVFADVRDVLAEGGRRFDVALLDLGDPIASSASQRAATREFYRLVARAVGAEGVVGLQAGAFETAHLRNYGRLLHTLGNTFWCVRPYHRVIPSFLSDWGFALASARELPAAPTGLADRIARLRGLRHYDAEGHRAMLWLSQADRELLSRGGGILTDRDPLPLAKAEAGP